jgi:hypothetical protein
MREVERREERWEGGNEEEEEWERREGRGSLHCCNPGIPSGGASETVM